MKPRTSGNKVIQIQGKDGKAFVKCTWRGSENQLSGSRFMGGKNTQKLRKLFKIMQHVWHVYISLAFSHAGDRTDRTVCSGCCKWQMTNQIHPRVNNVMCMDGIADGFNNQNHFRLPKQEHKCETASMYGMRKDDENNRQAFTSPSQI